MNINILEILLGQVPEAIYFSLFLIFTKGIKQKRLKFVISAVVEYVLLMFGFPYNVWSRILYFVALYLILKLFYDDKSNITDVFTLGIASIFLMIISFVSYVIVWLGCKDIIVGVILQKLLLFLFLFLVKNKLHLISKMYKKMWNRNDKVKKIMKSATFRCINVIVFNLMFYLLNIGIIISIIVHGRCL